jgi:hypothetical protein
MLKGMFMNDLADIEAGGPPVHSEQGQPVMTRPDQPGPGQVNLQARHRKAPHPAQAHCVHCVHCAHCVSGQHGMKGRIDWLTARNLQVHCVGGTYTYICIFIYVHTSLVDSPGRSYRNSLNGAHFAS